MGACEHRLQRLIATDPDEVMPPPEVHKTLTPGQIELIGHWIDEGAKWGAHWPFIRIEPNDSGATGRRGATSPMDAGARNKLRNLFPLPALSVLGYSSA